MSDLQNITPQDKWRMYGLTPYNMSSIQKAIQYGHAVVEYMLKYSTSLTPAFRNCIEWANNDKTFIILNGGTTNKTSGRLGTMNMHLEFLEDEFPDWPLATFYEPDFGDQLTAVVFLVPEQVYNKKDFPNFVDHLVKIHGKRFDYALSLEDDSNAEYVAWVKMMGGKANVDMRKFLEQFNLAN